jgi:hypothetical protein
MSKNEWELIQTIFEQAVALEGEARTSFIEESCSTNRTLRREVERLLAAHDAAEHFLSPLDGVKGAFLLAAAREEEIPETVGRYRVVRVLGSWTKRGPPPHSIIRMLPPFTKSAKRRTALHSSRWRTARVSRWRRGLRVARWLCRTLCALRSKSRRLWRPHTRSALCTAM